MLGDLEEDGELWLGWERKRGCEVCLNRLERLGFPMAIVCNEGARYLKHCGI